MFMCDILVGLCSSGQGWIYVAKTYDEKDHSFVSVFFLFNNGTTKTSSPYSYCFPLKWQHMFRIHLTVDSILLQVL